MTTTDIAVPLIVQNAKKNPLCHWQFCLWLRAPLLNTVGLFIVIYSTRNCGYSCKKWHSLWIIKVESLK